MKFWWSCHYNEIYAASRTGLNATWGESTHRDLGSKKAHSFAYSRGGSPVRELWPILRRRHGSRAYNFMIRLNHLLWWTWLQDELWRTLYIRHAEEECETLLNRSDFLKLDFIALGFKRTWIEYKYININRQINSFHQRSLQHICCCCESEVYFFINALISKVFFNRGAYKC